MSGGPNENLRARFEALGTDAGIALGTPPGTEPLEFWLHRLYFDLLEHKSSELFAGQEGKGGIITRVCIASATYCSRLQKEASVRETREQPKAKALESGGGTEQGTATEKTRPANNRKGDPTLLDGKDLVTPRIASQYLDNTDRHVRSLAKVGKLTSEGQGHNKKITTESLRRYLPPIKTEQKGTNH